MQKKVVVAVMACRLAEMISDSAIDSVVEVGLPTAG